jgi:hypothetical protein
MHPVKLENDRVINFSELLNDFKLDRTKFVTLPPPFIRDAIEQTKSYPELNTYLRNAVFTNGFKLKLIIMISIIILILSICFIYRTESPSEETVQGPTETFGVCF